LHDPLVPPYLTVKVIAWWLEYIDSPGFRALANNKLTKAFFPGSPEAGYLLSLWIHDLVDLAWDGFLWEPGWNL